MGKDGEKEETGFGFKDRAKAEETLRLLEAHEPQYRRLTVRGLLGRAKRVLSLTKAEDKMKNIKEAMQVFEDWLKELDKDKQKDQKKPEKKKSEEKETANGEKMEVDEREKSPPVDTVPGLGFKDKETAQKSLEILEGRDPDYQKLAVKGLVGRAKRVLTCTRDETKIQNIKDAVTVFEEYLDVWDKEGRGRNNYKYLSLNAVDVALDLAKERGLALDKQPAFVEAYREARGEYKRLRTSASEEGGPTWDIVRNKAIAEIKKEVGDSALFSDSGRPTDEEVRLLVWAHSSDERRAEALAPGRSRKRRAEPEPEPEPDAGPGREPDASSSASASSGASSSDEPDQKKRKD